MDNRRIFSEVQELCKSLSLPTKRNLVDSVCLKLQRHFEEANVAFVNSEEFEVILKGHLETLGGDKGEKAVFKSIWDLSHVLKGRKRAKRVALIPAENGTEEKTSSLQQSADDPGDPQLPSTSMDITNGREDPQEAARNDKNRRRIEKLEKKLGKLHRAIQKLSEREMTLDDMENSQSIHIQEHRLRNKLVRGWEMLCKLKKISTSTGRAKESRLMYRNSNYKEINMRVTKLMNKPDYFPDYQDVLDLITRANEKYSLGIDEVELVVLAREIFVDVGNDLKKRRQHDLVQSFGYADLHTASDDPAENDDGLRMKLKQNEHVSSKKLRDEMEKFSQEQRVREARGEDLEAVSEDEDEEEEDDLEDGVGEGAADEESYHSDDEPPNKKFKKESTCDDGVHCGTDSESSSVCGNDENHGKKQKTWPGLMKVRDAESETSDVDLFLLNDETATILTSGDEGSMTAEEQGCGDESEMSSVQSVVSLSDDDTEGDAGVSSGNEPDEIPHSRRESVPVKSENVGQRLNGFHQKEEKPLPRQKKTIQQGVPCTVLAGTEQTARNMPAATPSNQVSGDANQRMFDNDPIDNLGEEGLAPVIECHSYAFVVGRNENRQHSTSTSTSEPNFRKDSFRGHSEDSSDCIEILDSSSPSPSAPGEMEGKVRRESDDSDVVIISDSD